MKAGAFLCTKVQGKAKLHDLPGFNAVIAEYGDGEDFYLAIETVGRMRTRAQEKFFHGPVLKAFEPLGYRKDEAKELLCLRFIPQEIHQLDGTVVVVPGRTSRLKVDEYNELIDQCIQLAAENGQVVMDAGEWRARRLHEARQALKQEGLPV